MVLRKETDYEADIKRLRSDISMGKILRASMNLTAERWGFRGLRTEGSVHADLSQVMDYIPPEIKRNLKLSGLANMGWSFAGRLPGKEEMEGMKDSEKALALLRDRDIIRELDLTAGLKALSVRLTTADKKRVRVNEISTPKPVRVVMEKGFKKMNLGGAVSASIQELPYLGNLKEPLRVAFDVIGLKADMNRSKVTIDKGEFRFLERSVISWHGSMEKTDAGAIADVTVGPISVDLDEVYRTAKPFLPEDVGLNLQGLSRSHALTIGTIKLSGPVPKGPLTIALDDLTLRVPMVNLKQKEMSVSSRESSLSAKDLRVVLKDLFPSQATGAMTLHIDDLRVGGPKGVPYLGNLKEPLRVAFDVSGGGDMLKTFTITQSLRVSPLNLKQEARVSVSGLDKLMSKGQNRPLAELLEFMGGKAKFSLDIDNTDVSFVAKDAAVAGKIAIGADIDLLPRREIGLRGWMQAPGLDLTYGKIVDIKNLKSSLAVAKRYRLSIKEEGGPTGPPSALPFRPGAQAIGGGAAPDRNRRPGGGQAHERYQGEGRRPKDVLR